MTVPAFYLEAFINIRAVLSKTFVVKNEQENFVSLLCVQNLGRKWMENVIDWFALLDAAPILQEPLLLPP